MPLSTVKVKKLKLPEPVTDSFVAPVNFKSALPAALPKSSVPLLINEPFMIAWFPLWFPRVFALKIPFANIVTFPPTVIVRTVIRSNWSIPLVPCPIVNNLQTAATLIVTVSPSAIVTVSLAVGTRPLSQVVGSLQFPVLIEMTAVVAKNPCKADEGAEPSLLAVTLK